MDAMESFLSGLHIDEYICGKKPQPQIPSVHNNVPNHGTMTIHDDEEEDDDDSNHYDRDHVIGNDNGEEKKGSGAIADDLKQISTPFEGTSIYSTDLQTNHSCHPNVLVQIPSYPYYWNLVILSLMGMGLSVSLSRHCVITCD